MINALLPAISEARVAGFILVLARVSPLFVIGPMFSSRSMPPQVRGIAAVALTIGLTPVVLGPLHAQVPVGTTELIGLMAKELLVGLAFAFAVGALFHAVAIAGTLLDTIAGFSFAALVDPLTGAQSAVLSQVYGMFAVAIFVAIGGDAWVIEGLARTYDAVPLLASPDLPHLMNSMMATFSGIFVAALQVAAPVLLALVLCDAGFGILSRVVPQLNVFAVGFPAKLLVALGIVIVSLPFTGGFIAQEIPDTIANAVQAIK